MCIPCVVVGTYIFICKCMCIHRYMSANRNACHACMRVGTYVCRYVCMYVRKWGCGVRFYLCIPRPAQSSPQTKHGTLHPKPVPLIPTLWQVAGALTGNHAHRTSSTTFHQRVQSTAAHCNLNPEGSNQR